ncbi:unnamed protein product [Vitrella brassicaformis CCMP3155]|uniref:Uncharacterized protein n=1 Tax=Vitrella brassicaformis (strain CCMP3155) TaxID=1169540 RepID=A0A0G4G377_VITBC|nr:unnamed protein product [Vitrella brassicaformis CCMP3155]|eukprot:CEM22704.1 unnamed protein product [Vitrella brassicaformis CCMP3155]
MGKKEASSSSKAANAKKQKQQAKAQKKRHKELGRDAEDGAHHVAERRCRPAVWGGGEERMTELLGCTAAPMCKRLMGIKALLSREEWRKAIVQEITQRAGLHALFTRLCDQRATQRDVSVVSVKTEYIESVLSHVDAFRKQLVDYARDVRSLTGTGSSLAEYADMTPAQMRLIEEELSRVRCPSAIEERVARHRQPLRGPSVRERVEGGVVTLADGKRGLI